jgi:hypothetical protein
MGTVFSALVSSIAYYKKVFSIKDCILFSLMWPLMVIVSVFGIIALGLLYIIYNAFPDRKDYWDKD